MEDVLSVADYIQNINNDLAGHKARVVGEVTKVTVSARGHCYFNIKDEQENAILDCKMWASRYANAGLSIEEGMKLVAEGTPDIYAATGRFSFTVNKVEAAGEGDLIKAYKLLYEKFEKEGLFARKREIPEYVQRVGVVSSTGGVVKKDLLSNLRQIGLKVTLKHAAMEGASAPKEIVSAIEYFNTKANVDVVVVIRGGGGNYEILQAFNNESVCRAIFSSTIPVIAGIGHDVDVPLASLVADREASTPTGVAHIINSTWDEAFEELPRLTREIDLAFSRALDQAHNKVGQLLGVIDSRFREVFLGFERIVTAIGNGLSRIGETIISAKDKVQRTEQLLVLADPERNLKLGYSIIFGPKGSVVKQTGDISPGDNVKARVGDGEIESTVINVSKK